MSCHPGCSTDDMFTMKKDIQAVFGFLPKQVQACIPLPMTLSSVIYFTGLDPLSGDRYRTNRDTEERRIQHNVIIQKRPIS
jgi:hypothetical protein